MVKINTIKTKKNSSKHMTDTQKVTIDSIRSQVLPIVASVLGAVLMFLLSQIYVDVKGMKNTMTIYSIQASEINAVTKENTARLGRGF